MLKHSSGFGIIVLTALWLLALPIGAVTQMNLDEGIQAITRSVSEKMGLEKKQDIAIVRFSYLDGSEDRLCLHLAEELTTALAATKRFRIIERKRIKELFTEQQFQLTDAVDPETTKKLGKILGVEAIVVGSVSDMGESLKINARLLSTATGEVFDAAGAAIFKDAAVKALQAGTQSNAGTSTASAEAPKSGSAPAFEDNFDAGLKPDWDSASGEWRVADRTLTRINCNDQGDYRIFVGDTGWKNYVIDVDYKSDYNAESAIIFRAKNNRNFFTYMMINSYGWWQILKDGQWSAQISKKEFKQASDKWNHVKIEATNDVYVVYVNGNEVSMLQDSTHMSGKVGLRILGCQGCYFDNFKISPL